MMPTNECTSFAALTGTQTRIKVVDIGANPIDTAPPYGTLLNAGEAELIGFEPNPLALEKLNEKKGPNETYLPFAIGDGQRRTLHVCHAPGMTSLLEPNPAVLDKFHCFPIFGMVVETRPVDTVRFDDIPQTVGAELLKIDIQGAELMVFQHGTRRLRDLLVIHTEVEFLQMYMNQPLFSDIELFLRQHGFVFHRFYPATSRVISPMLVDNDIYGGMSQLLWADAIFVKDFTRLNTFEDIQLLNMAKIVHECYKSFDLAYRLLSEFDQRRSTALAHSYLGGLQSIGQKAAA